MLCANVKGKWSIKFLTVHLFKLQKISNIKGKQPKTNIPTSIIINSCLMLTYLLPARDHFETNFLHQLYYCIHTTVSNMFIHYMNILVYN